MPKPSKERYVLVPFGREYRLRVLPTGEGSISLSRTAAEALFHRKIDKRGVYELKVFRTKKPGTYPVFLTTIHGYVGFHDSAQHGVIPEARDMRLCICRRGMTEKVQALLNNRRYIFVKAVKLSPVNRKKVIRALHR